MKTLDPECIVLTYYVSTEPIYQLISLWHRPLHHQRQFPAKERSIRQHFSTRTAEKIEHLFQLIVSALQCFPFFHQIGQCLFEMRNLPIVFIAVQLLFDLLIAPDSSFDHILSDTFLVL